MQALVGFVKMHLNNVHAYIDQEIDLADRGDKLFRGQPGAKSSPTASESVAGGTPKKILVEPVHKVF